MGKLEGTYDGAKVDLVRIVNLPSESLVPVLDVESSAPCSRHLNGCASARRGRCAVDNRGGSTGGARNGSRGEEDVDPAEGDVAAGHWSR